MKKLLLTTAACGLAMAATPANAQVSLDLGGYFKGYGAYVDQDETTGNQVNDFDMIRDTELHFTGETTLDNGLTVGFHAETDADGNDSLTIDESYAYFAGSWGRVNVGAEDGASYLLQVAAPSADSNIDGIRQYVQPVDNTTLFATAGTATTFDASALDYDQDPTGKTDKITYMTPIFSGFQAGVSFTPDSDNFADDLEGIGTDNVAATAGQSYEVAARYEGQIDMVGIIVGAGYSHVELEAATTPVAAGVRTDDRQVWNVGLDLDIGAFGIGAIYKEDNAFDTQNAANTSDIDDEEVFVVGVDYTTGPFKLGASYYDAENTLGIEGLESQRYQGGVTYTYGPGMTFNGSIGYVEHEDTNVGGAGQNDVDATYVTLGTQINF